MTPPPRATVRPDTVYRRTIEKLLNRLFRRHDLQPPMLTPFTAIMLAIWLAGVGLAYARSPLSVPRLRVGAAMVYSWTTLALPPPTGASAFKQPLAWGVSLALLAPVLIQVLAATGAAAKARYLPEATRLAKQQGRLHPAELVARQPVRDGIPLGEYRGRRFGIRRGADAGHVLVAAPTRAGKGLHLTGTLETWQGPAVVVDPKGEQYRRTSGARAALGPIYHIPSHGLDILRFFDVAQALDLQELFTTLLQTWQDNDPIFSQKAYALFEAARAQGRATGEHLLTILARWAGMAAPAVMQEAAPHAPGPIAQFTDGSPPDELNRFTLSAWGTFTAKLSALVPHIPTLSRGDVPTDWAEQGATIYICYPLDQLEAAGGLVSVMLTALIKGQQRAATKNYTLMAIDELRASRLHGLDTKLATVGGYGVTILAYVQQLSQLNDVYGREAAASIIGNFHHQVFYPTRDNESAQYVSTKVGTEVQLRRADGAGGRASYSQAISAALDPSMVNTLPPTATVVFTDDRVTLAQRVNPFTKRRVPFPDPHPITIRRDDGVTVVTIDGKVLARTKVRTFNQIVTDKNTEKVYNKGEENIQTDNSTSETSISDTSDEEPIYF